jgi:hypothetical protein
MGRLIDADKLVEYLLTPPWNVGWDDEIEIINNQPTVEAIPKADYENRLKADLVAMLTDFLMDIEENTSINSDDSHERNGKRLMRTEIIGMFEQKINSLKEKSNEL